MSAWCANPDSRFGELVRNVDPFRQVGQLLLDRRDGETGLADVLSHLSKSLLKFGQLPLRRRGFRAIGDEHAAAWPDYHVARLLKCLDGGLRCVEGDTETIFHHAVGRERAADWVDAPLVFIAQYRRDLLTSEAL